MASERESKDSNSDGAEASHISSSSSFKERLSAFVPKPPKVEFAPTVVPARRRFQTLAVAFYETQLALAVMCFFFLCSIPVLWPLIIMYIIWLRFDSAPENGGRINQWFRRLLLWKLFAEYYPAVLKKECDLPPDRPYVFGYHPHGIIGMGAFATFATESTGFTENFPGIVPHLLTLSSNFNVPIYRDILLHLGVCSVSKQSCSNILNQGSGSAICIVVGGAAESLAAHPGTADLTLRRRLGFLKVAIQHGADLVPVFSFGENDIFDQMPNNPGSLLWKVQKRFQKMFGFTLPFFYGRGLLNYNFGLIPYRRSIVTVVGRPIHTTKTDKPTMEEVSEVQQQYIVELTRIWEMYKDSFARSRTKDLQIID